MEEDMKVKVTDVLNAKANDSDSGNVKMWFDAVIFDEVQLCGCKIMFTNGNLWVALPSKPSSRNPKNYFLSVKFLSGREVGDSFTEQCLALLTQKAADETLTDSQGNQVAVNF